MELTRSAVVFGTVKAALKQLAEDARVCVLDKFAGQQWQVDAAAFALRLPAILADPSHEAYEGSFVLGGDCPFPHPSCLLSGQWRSSCSC